MKQILEFYTIWSILNYSRYDQYVVDEVLFWPMMRNMRWKGKLRGVLKK